MYFVALFPNERWVAVHMMLLQLDLNIWRVHEKNLNTATL